MIVKPRKKRKWLRLFWLLPGLLLVACVAHRLVFPEETRAILVRFSYFKRSGRLYYSDSTPASEVTRMHSLIEQASKRVATFWNGQQSNPRFIYCETQEEFARYSISPDAPACTYCKLGEHIVVNADGMDADIIAHEISHAEFYARVGFYIWSFKIPDWFKHGLAMQNDYRIYYSTDTLIARTDSLKTLPDVTKLKTSQQFYSGSPEEVMLHYMAAKYRVALWFTRDRLAALVAALRKGDPFDEAFAETELMNPGNHTPD